MPNTYTANAHLKKDNKVVKPNEQITLTTVEAQRLSKKGLIKESVNSKVSETEFRELSADDQKKLVEEKGGNLNDLTNEDKRAKYFMDNQ